MTTFKTDNLLQAGFRRAKRLAGRSLYLPTEAPHFQVEVDGQWYVFCAIHKNASSSMRSLVEAGSPVKRNADESIFRFLFLNHLLRSQREVERARHVMVFVRHPLERIVSCFQNKFIQQTGNRTIFHDYTKVTGADPRIATFEQFVFDYLRPCFEKGGRVKPKHDRHIYTQQQQLLPVNYDLVARVDQFDNVMVKIGLGQLLSERANTTSGATAMPRAFQRTAEELNTHYRDTRETPNKNALLTPELEDTINHLYRMDLRIFGYLFETKSE